MRTFLRSKVTLLFLTFAVAIFAVAGAAMALTTDGSGTTSLSPTIQSDKADYAPGAFVTLTGGNWQPGESVNIKVNDTYGASWSRNVDVTADASGNITDSFNLPDAFVSDYDVTATGARSGTATTTFTDNKPNTVAVTPGSTTVAQGGTTNYTVTVGMNGDNTTACTVTLSAVGLPPNTTHSFSGGNPRTVSATTNSFTSILTVNTTNQTPGKTFPFTVHATSQASSCQNAQDIIGSASLTVSDATAPSVAITSPSSPSTTNSTINVSGTASDASGIQGVTVNGNVATFAYDNGSSTNGTWSYNNLSLSCGPNTITAIATDDSNNHQTRTTSVNITRNCDTTPPSITPTIQGTQGNNGWYTSNVTVSWTVNDPDSTVTNQSGCGSTTISSDTNGQTLTCTATSAGGPNSQSVTIKRDATKPTINGTRLPGANANGWNNTDVTVSYTCSDSSTPGSGLASGACPAAQTVSDEGANQSRTGTVTDQAGNSNSATVSGINIDKTAPTIEASRSPEANANGWNNTDVTVSYTCSDNDGGSGLSGTCPEDDTLSTEAANQSATGHVVDKAGNPASDSVSGVNIDKSAPTSIAFSGGGPANNGVYTYGNVPSAPTGCTADGAISGLDSCDVSGYSAAVNAPGTHHTMTATATDNAGNEGTLSHTYTVNKAPQEITFGALAGKTYGDAAFTVSATGGASGQPVTFTADGPCTVTSSGTVTITGAGSGTEGCTITASQAGNSNYEDAEPVSRSFDIAKAPITIKAKSDSREYGEANPTLDYDVVSGSFKYNDLGNGLSVDLATTATATSPVGSYDITVALSGTKADNYDLTAQKGTLQVTQAPLTVNTADKERFYGDPNPAFTGGIDGIKNGDDITATYSTTATLTSNVGPYPITATLHDPDNKLGNYSVTNDGGTLTVKKAPLSVTANSRDKVYGDALTGADFSGTIAGIKNSDPITASYSSTGAAATSVVNTYPILPVVNATAAVLANYQDPVVLNNGTLTVKPAPITIKANDASRLYGDPNPDLGYTILSGSFKNGDLANNLVSVNVSTIATSTSLPGSYPITVALGTGTAGNKAGNYALTAQDGTLTIGKWSLKGFYAPVDMDTTTTTALNTVKNGSTVPMKFNVLKGATELTDNTNNAVVKSFTTTPVACPSTGYVADAIEFTTTGGTSLRYDATGGQWVQNWQTPKKAGACYDVTMTTQDGSKLVAHFQLK